MNRPVLLILVLFLTTASLAHAQHVPVTTTSDDARLHYVRGVHAVTFADFERANAHFEAAVAADPDFSLAHLNLAGLTSGDEQAGHFRRAKTAGARASEAERQIVESFEADLNGDPDRRVALLSSVAERYPSDPLMMFFASFVELGRGNHAEAVAAARRALDADPSFAPAYNAIGYAEMAQGNEAAAERAFREQIRLAPDQANPYDSLGEFLLEQGKLDEAERQFEQALTKDPTFEVARDNLARIAVMRASADHIAAINRQDADAFVDFFTETAVESPSDGSQAAGREAIRTNVSNFLAAGKASIDLVNQEIQPMGDGFAYQRGDVTMRLDGAVVQQGIITRLWVETPEGWKIARDNLDLELRRDDLGQQLDRTGWGDGPGSIRSVGPGPPSSAI